MSNPKFPPNLGDQFVDVGKVFWILLGCYTLLRPMAVIVSRSPLNINTENCFFKI